MQTASTFTDVGWDWVYEAVNGTNDYWAINPGYNSGYPFLEWSGFPLPFAPHGGYTLNFDGVDDYVEVAHDASLNPSEITVEAWFYPTDVAGQTIPPIVKKASTTEGYALEIDESTSELRFYVRTAGAWYSSPAYVVPVTHRWYHAARSYDGTDIKLYVDGKYIGATTIAGSISHLTNSLTIGYDMVNTGRYFEGYIDEVRIWSDIRSHSEIQAHMHKELAGDESNLVAYYAMYDGSGTALADNSGNGFTGTLTNDPTWTTSGAHAGPKMALDFDGVDDYLYAPLNGDATASFTIEGWFSFNSLTNQQNIINIHQTGDPTIRAVPYKTAANEVAFFIHDGTRDYVLTSSSVIAQAHVWHHLVFIYDAGTMTIYVDGQLAGSATGQGSFSTGATNLFSVGADYNGTGAGFYANIKADEVRFWSDVRTEAEIRAYMYRTLDGDEDSLEAYYRFDQQADASHGTLYDQTANAHHGTLANMDPATDWVASTAFNTWIGSDDSDWSNADNWSLGATPTTEDVGVFGWVASKEPASANISARHFYLDAGVTLDHTGNLTLSGDFYNAGTFSTSGTVTCSGSTAQRIQGTGSTTFGDFVVNNASGVTLYQDLATTDLTLTAGALSLDDQTLSIEGDISKNTGTLSGTSSRGIAIGGSAAALTILPAVDLGSLSLDRSASIRLSGTVSVASTLTHPHRRHDRPEQQHPQPGQRRHRRRQPRCGRPHRRTHRRAAQRLRRHGQLHLPRGRRHPLHADLARLHQRHLRLGLCRCEPACPKARLKQQHDALPQPLLDREQQWHQCLQLRRDGHLRHRRCAGHRVGTARWQVGRCHMARPRAGRCGRSPDRSDSKQFFGLHSGRGNGLPGGMAQLLGHAGYRPGAARLDHSP
ncbi:MAG: hypothetical protein OHK0039_06500 [Bacteroidia bacterium]